MPVMVTGAINLEEQLVTIKATMDMLLKESTKKDEQIKHQNKYIIDLTKKLWRWTFKASNKGSGGEDSDKKFNDNE